MSSVSSVMSVSSESGSKQHWLDRWATKTTRDDDGGDMMKEGT
jgi:hypothetical protein